MDQSIHRRSRLARKPILIFGALLLVGLIAAACGGGGGGDFDNPGLQTFDDAFTSPGQAHNPPAAFATLPPYGGPHDGNLLPCGVYDSEQDFSRMLHTMEHGAVIIYYHPDLFTPDEANQVRAVALDLLRSGNRIVFTPHRSIDARIAVASWGRLLFMEQFDEEALRGFVAAFENDAPENLPLEFSC